MKKIIVSLSLLLSVTASTAFAHKETRRDPGIEEIFKQEFAGAENVTWSRQDNYQKATFVLAGHRVIAYFDEDNQLAGCIRNIFFDQLPMTVMKAVDKRFAEADIQDVRETSNTEGTFYTMTAELDQKKYRIKVSSYGVFLDIEKLKK
jgi:hypothetical protein